MKLTYHEGRNFGDMLNPMIFKHFIGDVLDENEEVMLLGIGSILGLKRPKPETKKVIVFSSGYAAGMESTYGKLPKGEELDIYDFVCVRGPKTAEKLGLDPAKAVCDGAVLISDILPIDPERTADFPFSFIPHVGSLNFYSQWKELLLEVGIHLIDPRWDAEKVIDDIQHSGLVFCEAMHGAIIADTYRIPWVPVAAYSTINTFKWEDYCSSLDMNYEPHRCPPLFDRSMVQTIFHNKFKPLPKFITNIMGGAYHMIRNKATKEEVKRFFMDLKEKKGQLSDRELLKKKQGELLGLMGVVAREAR